MDWERKDKFFLERLLNCVSGNLGSNLDIARNLWYILGWAINVLRASVPFNFKIEEGEGGGRGPQRIISNPESRTSEMLSQGHWRHGRSAWGVKANPGGHQRGGLRVAEPWRMRRMSVSGEGYPRGGAAWARGIWLRDLLRVSYTVKNKMNRLQCSFPSYWSPFPANFWAIHHFPIKIFLLFFLPTPSPEMEGWFCFCVFR